MMVCEVLNFLTNNTYNSVTDYRMHNIVQYNIIQFEIAL